MKNIQCYSELFNTKESNFDDDDYIDDETFREMVQIEVVKPLVPKPLFHKCKDDTIVCLNYDKPYNTNYNKMTDSHLLNTIPYLIRRAINYVESIGNSLLYLTPLNGEVADFSIDQMIMDIMDIDNKLELKKSLFNTWLNDNKFQSYVDEAKTRKLNLKIVYPYYDDEDRIVTYLVDL